MDLDHVRTFVHVVDERGFRRASQALGLSQPTVSRQVHQLETSLGVELFVRGPRGVELTPAGATFLAHARSLLAAEDEARRQVAWEPTTRTCHVGVVEGAASQLTAPLLRGLVHRLTGVQFRFVTLPLARYAGHVPQGLDLLLAREPWREDDVRVTVLFEEPVSLVVPPGSPLAGAASVSVEDALGSPVIGIDEAMWAPLARYWTLADHGTPQLLHAGHSPTSVARVFRTHQVNGLAPRSVLPGLRRLSGPFATTTIQGLRPNRSALLSRADDGRRLVGEVHRCALGLATVLGPLLLPPYAVAGRSVAHPPAPGSRLIRDPYHPRATDPAARQGGGVPARSLVTIRPRGGSHGEHPPPGVRRTP